MTNHSATLDTTFAALANPTRRAILGRLAQGPATVTELARPFDMALPSLMLHLKKLEQVGLLRSTKQGRVRTCFVEAAPLEEAAAWLVPYKALWERRLDRLEALLDAETDDD